MPYFIDQGRRGAEGQHPPMVGQRSRIEEKIGRRNERLCTYQSRAFSRMPTEKKKEERMALQRTSSSRVYTDSPCSRSIAQSAAAAISNKGKKKKAQSP